MDNEFEKNDLLPEEEEAVDAFVPEETAVPEPIPEDSTYRYKPAFAQEFVAPQYVPQPSETPKKKKGHGRKVVALGLCCGLLGGICGAVGTFLGIRFLQEKDQATPAPTPIVNGSGIFEGERGNSVIEIEKIDTSKLMSAAEVYATNVNSTVSVNCKGTSSGYWVGQQSVASAGSGFILSHDGYVLTNYHVVEGMDTIEVALYDKRVLAAKLIGYDESNDIAVLKAEGENLTPVVLGDSDNLNVGDSVVAIGNPLGELSFTLTSGYISAKNRVVTMSSGATMTLLQTDCPINSGNSGGALFNMYGEVIGITNAKYSNNGSSTEASIDNIGFAIPMNRVKEIVFSIIEKGMVTKPYVGISVMNVTDQMLSWGVPNGAWVTAVESGSPAAKGGLRVDDIITHLDGKTVDNNSTLVAMVGACKPGQSVVFTVYRGGRTVDITVVIGEKIQSATGE